MNRISLAAAMIAGFLFFQCGQPSLARGNDLTIKDGFGEEIVIKNGLFGGQQRVVKDRLGNHYASKKGWFGSKETSVNVMGNEFKKKKGWFGGSDIEGHSMLGDTVSTKKGIFGRRTTTVDVSGISGLIRGLLNEDKIPGTSAAAGAASPGLGVSGNLDVVTPAPSSADPLDRDVLADPN
jgi:hypothetical protein